MMTAPGGTTAYLMDFFPDLQDHPCHLIDSLVSQTVEECDLIFALASNLLKVSVAKTLPEYLYNKIENLETTERANAFYSAKVLLDKKNITNIVILCSNRDRQYWDSLLDNVLTDVYVWSTLSVDNQEMEPHNVDNIVQGFKAYVRSLPGSGDINLLKSPIIPDMFYHGFSCRTGGLSTMPGMQSLNLVFTNAKRDPRILIEENRRRLSLKAEFNVEDFHVANTVHGNVVHVVGETRPNGYDGVATNKLGVTVGAPGADCIIILFADPVTGACAALHSGWMGTVKRACVQVLSTMKSAFRSNASDIYVVLGPSIGPCCFEFDSDKTDQFKDIAPDSVTWKEGQPKAFVNLQMCNRVLLEENGVKPENIDDRSCAKCTSCNPDLFFSYRRDSKPFGNQLGIIGRR